MSLPETTFPFRIEHPDAPGVVFDLAHTQDQAESKLAWLLNADRGFVIVPNVASAPAAAIAPEVPVPDTLALWLDELVQSEGSRDAAYKFLFDHLAIAQGHKQDVAIAAAAMAGEAADLAEPTPPEACPFEVGNHIADRNSDTLAVVDSIDDAAGVMHVLLPDRSAHQVPALNYGDFKLVHKATPKEFFTVKPKAKTAPAPAGSPVPAKRKRKSRAKKITRRNPADLLKAKNN